MLTCVECIHYFDDSGDHCVFVGSVMGDLEICDDFVEIIDVCNDCEKCGCGHDSPQAGD